MNPAMTVVICIVIGLFTGVVSALCGVGGGIIMVPAFVAILGMTQKNAVATSLAAIILTSVAASLRNTGANLIDWKVTVPTGIAAAVVAWFASGWLKSMSNVTLTRLFGVLVIVVGVQMLWSTRNGEAPTKPAATATPERPAAR